MMLSPAKWWAVFIGIATVEVLLLIKLLVYRSSTDLLVSICAIAVLLILTLRVQDLESISFDRMEFKQNFVILRQDCLKLKLKLRLIRRK